MSGGLTPNFNRLSRWDRTALGSATLITSLSGIAREDTKLHPLRYPFYAVYLGLMIAPVPLIHIPLSLAVVGVIWSEATPWARWAKGRMKADFEQVTMIEKHREYIVPKRQTADEFKVRNAPLLGHIAKTVAKDAAAATRSFGSYVRS